MKGKTAAHTVRDDLLLHDALVKDVRITEINFAERNVEIFFNSAEAMSDVGVLRLERCRKLETDHLVGCWWMGEKLTKDENGVSIECELVTASGEKRKLIAQCQRLVAK